MFELQTERQEELQEFCTDISYPFDDLLCCSLIRVGISGSKAGMWSAHVL